jgi:hypothetical protein
VPKVVIQEPKVLKVLKDQQVLRELRGPTQEPKVLQVLEDRKGLKVLREVREHKVMQER